MNWKGQLYRRSFIILLSLLGMQQLAVSQVGDTTVRHLKTATGLEFGLWGGNKENKPAPLLLILASSIDETLGTEYFRQCGNRLARENGWLCASLDLPYHGKLQKGTTQSPLVSWSNAVKRGEDFIADNNRRMKEILDYLIDKHYADAANVFVCGTSRGGYMGLQFAAVEPRVRSVAAVCPCIDLLVPREFSGIDRNTILPVFNLDNAVDSLSKKDIWIVIGDRDDRVGTDVVIAFARKISRAFRTNNAGGRIELDVMWEPKGHHTPKGAVDRGVDWLLQGYKKIDICLF
jgi:pimeloyl-ACP methyl ester carboxylesterase